jgi:hypothetical protein
LTRNLVPKWLRAEIEQLRQAAQRSGAMFNEQTQLGKVHPSTLMTPISDIRNATANDAMRLTHPTTPDPVQVAF